jgi:ABC-type oligopeptide transport system ATPase subunit
MKMVDTAIVIFSVTGSILLIGYQAYKRIVSDYHHWKLSLKDREYVTEKDRLELERLQKEIVYSQIQSPYGHMVVYDHKTGKYIEFEKSVSFAPPQDEQIVDQAGNLPPVLPLLNQAQRILLVGGSGSGKTTLMHHLVDARLSQGRVIIFDPHDQAGKWNAYSVGGGRDYQAIESGLQEVLTEMNNRYESYSSGTPERGFDRLSIFIDEFVNLSLFIPGLQEIIKPLLVESRKVGIDILIAGQSKRARNLSLSGNYDLLSSFDVKVDLINESGIRKCLVDTGNGDPQEMSLPGVYMSTGRHHEPGKGCKPGGVNDGCNGQNGGVHRDNYTSTRSTRATPKGNIDHIPEEDFKILDLWKSGFSLSKISKKIFNSKGGFQLQKIREVLKKYGREDP